MNVNSDSTPVRSSSINATVGGGTRGQPLSFTSQLLKVNKDLEKSDIDKLKYLVRDELSRGELEKVKEGLDLFQLLKNSGRIGDSSLGQGSLEYLIHLLAAIRLGKIAKELNGGRLVRKEELTTLNQFRLDMLKCSEDLNSQDLTDIKFLLGGYPDFSTRERESAASLLDLVNVLEESGKSPQQITEIVRNWLTAIGKTSNPLTHVPAASGDVGRRPGAPPGYPPFHPPTPPQAPANDRHRFFGQGTAVATSLHHQTVCQRPVRQETMSNFQIPIPHGIPRQPVQLQTHPNQRQVFPNQTRPAPHQPTFLQEVLVPRNMGLVQQAPDPRRVPVYEVVRPVGQPLPAGPQFQQMTVGQVATLPPVSDDIYDRRGRGLCLIINNKLFVKNELYADDGDEDPKSLTNREGTEKDENRIKEVLVPLNYEVVVENDLGADKMREFAQAIAKKDLSRYGALVFVVLSHGSEGKVFGSDGYSVSIDELKEPFGSTNCPSLSGKPKVFLIQACQGEGVETVQSDGAGVGPNPTSPTISPKGLNSQDPNQSDFFIGLATVQGNESYRAGEGTWFIQNLFQNIATYALQDQRHFSDIFTKANNDVTKKRGNIDCGGKMVVVRQIPEARSTLRKDFYLRRI